MNEPGVSLDTLARLEEAEQDRAMEMIMRKRGFTGTELTYEEIDGERRLLISGKALNYIMAHKKSIRREIEKAATAASIRALEAGMAIIELQKAGGRK